MNTEPILDSDNPNWAGKDFDLRLKDLPIVSTKARFFPSRFSPFRNVTIPACGHGFAPGFAPRMSNCGPCWFTYFQTHAEATEEAVRIVSEGGPGALSARHGHKYAKHFLTFQATLAAWGAENVPGTPESEAA